MSWNVHRGEGSFYGPPHPLQEPDKQIYDQDKQDKYAADSTIDHIGIIARIMAGVLERITQDLTDKIDHFLFPPSSNMINRMTKHPI